jgi:hypothetical protein
MSLLGIKMLNLEKIYPILSPEGYIVLDDYHEYNGCKKSST